MKPALPIVSGLVVLGFAVPPASPPSPPRVLAHYMPWFKAEKTADGTSWDHWQWFGKGKKHDPDTILDNGRRDIAAVHYPLIGPYDGRDAAVLEYHFLTAKAAGIGGFIADWYGPGSYSDEVFARMVKTAERCGQSVAICLEEKTFFNEYAAVSNRADVQDVMTRQVRHVLDTHARSKAYLRWRGRPVLFIFNGWGDSSVGNMNLTPEELSGVLARFSKEKPLLVRQDFDGRYAGVAEGFYLWAGDARYREAFYTNALAAGAVGRPGLVVGGASPGFDDSGVNGWGRGPRFTDRRGTQEYEDNWAQVLRYRPDLVQVITWNDFQEGTTIEPTEDYGFGFVDLTESMISRLTGRKASPGDNAWPLRLYRLRKKVEGVADAAARATWTEQLDRFSDDFAAGRRFLMGWRLGRLEAKAANP